MANSPYLYYYEQFICDTLICTRNIHSVMQLPYLQGVTCVASSSSGKHTCSTKGALELITGQRAKTTRARRSIAAFNLRENTIVSCQVTLRKHQLYSFLDLFVNFIMPQWDFTLKQNAENMGTPETHKGNQMSLGSREKRVPLRIHNLSLVSSNLVFSTLTKTISFGQSNFFSFPQLFPYFPQFEFTKGCNMHIMVKPKRCTVASQGKNHIWGF